MRPRKVAEKLARAAALVAAAGCASNHHVSPWGSGPGAPPVSAYLPAEDLVARLAQIDAEAQRADLTLTVELGGELPEGGGPLRVRGYLGKDALGRPTHAVRVATSRSIVMAVGPLAAGDAVREGATELVAALQPGPGGGLQGSAYRSGTDLNGDGAPDVVVRDEGGGLEVWRLAALGAARYEVEMQATPSRGADVDGDGWPDLVGDAAVGARDPIHPRLEDAATFENGRYSDRTAGARGYHARAAEALEPPVAGPEAKPGEAAVVPPAPRGLARPGAGPGEPTAGAPPPAPRAPLTEEGARRAVERAWHELLAGQPGAGVLRELDRETVGATLRGPFATYRRRLEELAKRVGP